jgi:hypothetical protein
MPRTSVSPIVHELWILKLQLEAIMDAYGPDS